MGEVEVAGEDRVRRVPIPLVKVKDLVVEPGDVVVSRESSFLVLEVREQEHEVEGVWLESMRRDVIWREDALNGPVEVIKKTA